MPKAPVKAIKKMHFAFICVHLRSSVEKIPFLYIKKGAHLQRRAPFLIKT